MSSCGEEALNLFFFLALGLVGEDFLFVDFLGLGPDTIGLASSEVGSTETGAGCVGSNITEVSKCSFKYGESEGIIANMWSGRRLTGPNEDWSEILYTLTSLKEIHTSGGIVFTGMGTLSSLKTFSIVRAQNLVLEISFAFLLMADLQKSCHKTSGRSTALSRL